MEHKNHDGSAALDIEFDGRVLTIWLARPDKRNALSHEMIVGIDDVLRRHEHNPDLRLVIFRARGSAFSSGHDLAERSDREPTEDRYAYESRYFYETTMYVRNYPVVTMCVVTGACVAAGLMIAEACDLIIASENASFSNPVLRMGGVATQALFEPWDVGVRAAKYLLFTGDAIDAKRAQAMGLVNEVVAESEIDAEVARLNGKITNMPPFTMKLVKRSLNYAQDCMGMAQALDHHFIMHQMGHSSEESQSLVLDARRGRSVREFLEQRDAKFGSVTDE